MSGMKTRGIVSFTLTKQAIGWAMAGLTSALLLISLDIGYAAQPSSEQIPLKLSGPPVTSPRPAWNSEVRQVKVAKIPVIDVTDLYHPCQDIGDNFDLITAYALPEIDLRAVILDCTDEWRSGSRLDPGFIPVTQLTDQSLV